MKPLSTVCHLPVDHFFSQMHGTTAVQLTTGELLHSVDSEDMWVEVCVAFNPNSTGFVKFDDLRTL